MSDSLSISGVVDHAKIVSKYASKRWLWEFLNNKIGQLEKTEAKTILSDMGKKIVSKFSREDKEDPSIKSIIDKFDKYQEENRKRKESGEKYRNTR